MVARQNSMIYTQNRGKPINTTSMAKIKQNELAACIKNIDKKALEGMKGGRINLGRQFSGETTIILQA